MRIYKVVETIRKLNRVITIYSFSLIFIVLAVNVQAQQLSGLISIDPKVTAYVPVLDPDGNPVIDPGTGEPVTMLAFQSGSYFSMGGDNPMGGVSLRSGPAGGIILGTHQNFVLNPDEPHPANWNGTGGLAGTGFDRTPTAKSTALRPFSFFGISTYIGLNPVSYQSGESHPAPAVWVDADGNLTAELSSWEVMWNGSAFEQGPRPVNTGPFVLATGTYDAATGHYMLEWKSQIKGGPFNGVPGFWHLEGTYYQDLDMDGAFEDSDCDDNDPNRFPGNPAETIGDMYDSDCDGFDGIIVDADGDGSYSMAYGGSDCNDADPAILPGVTDGVPDTCDGFDNDCDGTVDEDVITYYLDADGDGFGNPDDTLTTDACSIIAPIGFVDNSQDCNDSDAAIQPDAAESINGADDNCNGLTDETIGSLSPNTSYEMRIYPMPVKLTGTTLMPVAQDATGNYNTSFTFSALPGSGSNIALDNGLKIDSDKNLVGDFGSGIDGDGYYGLITFTTNSDASGFTINSVNLDTIPGTTGGNFAQEYHPNENVQNNAGMDPTPVGEMVGTLGMDGSMIILPEGRTGGVDATDGFKDLAGSRWNYDNTIGNYNTFTTGTSTNETGSLTGRKIIDNSDGTFSVTLVLAGTMGADWGSFEGVPYTEVWNARIVPTAAGVPNPFTSDNDGDGYTEVDGDCNDSDAAVHPGVSEVPYNGVDEDCSGINLAIDQLKGQTAPDVTDPSPDDDLDNDGFGVTSGDCDDTDPNRNSGVQEIAGNGIDDNCNNMTDELWMDLPEGTFRLDIDPDLANINAGNDAFLETYFFMGSHWQAIPGSNNTPIVIRPDNGQNESSAGVIYFTAEANGSAMNLTILGQPRESSSDGYVYPGNYRIAKFTSPGGQYTSYIEGIQLGSYELGSGKMEFQLADALADTQYAGARIPFPYHPLTTERAQNTSESYTGVRVQYMGVSSYDINDDGAVDANDIWWSVKLVTAGNVPDSVPGFAGVPFGHVFKGRIIFVSSTINKPPIADVGINRVAGVGDTLILDGSNSSDPDPDDSIASYIWNVEKRPAGSSAVLLDASSDGEIPYQKVSFVADKEGIYTFSLVVTDTSQGDQSEKATISVLAWSELMNGGSMIDTDGDGLPDSLEDTLGFDPNYPDTDGDGVADGMDAFPSEPSEYLDSDGDGVGDNMDNVAYDPTQSIVMIDHCGVLRIRAGAGQGGSGSNKLALMNVRELATGNAGIDPADLPDKAVIVSYDVDVCHPSLGPGSPATLTIDIPCGIKNPALYKIVGRKLYSFDELGIRYFTDTMGSHTVSFTLTDGEPNEDEDDLANGVIVDPVVIGEASSTNTRYSSKGGGCALNPGSGNPGDIVLLFIPILIVIGIKWFRKGMR